MDLPTIVRRVLLISSITAILLASLGSIAGETPRSTTTEAHPVEESAPAPFSSTFHANTPEKVRLSTASTQNLPEAPTPASETPLGGWQGLNYSSACTSTSCLPADPDMATGNGYAFEVAGSAYRIWTSDSALVLNGSLSSLFGTGSDTLLAPQVRYDPSTLRWFVSVEDLSKDQVYYGGSLSSDPTGTWNIQHFNPGGGEVPTQPTLAVNAVNLVVTTNLYRAGVFKGAQIWVANKSQLLNGGGVNTWSNPPNPSNISLIPADPSGRSAVMYLVSDATGGSELDLFSLSGSPPATPTLSAPVAFPSVTLAPPNATQPGTSNLVSTGTAQVQSAVWQAGALWATAAVSCTPSGDTVARSCLHLWKLSTATDTLEQSFNWSTGAGTYDYYPALSVDTAGDIAVVFEASSSATYPGVYATAQSFADPPATLEPALVIKAGTGPDNPAGSCPGGVCPFGNYSGSAATPLAPGVFFLVGEYTGSDSATDYWHTWVEADSVADTYPVKFTENDLPSGDSWSVTVNGVVTSSSSSTITLNETNGAYTFTVLSPISGGTGAQFVAVPSSGSFSVASASVSEPIEYTEQFELTTSVTPTGAGTVSPSEGWFNASSSVAVSALASVDHAFASWIGSGSGAYTGTADPAPITMDGPLSEQAQFFTSVTYVVTFSESGIPQGTDWTVGLNGVLNSSTSSSVTFNEPNGSYSFTTGGVITGSTGVRYVANLSSGTFDIRGNGVGLSISYLTQYELTTSVAPSASGTVSPSDGWFNASSPLNVSALADPGHAFASWVGTGPGAYSGSSDPAVITMAGPVTEQARFLTEVTFPVTFSETGLPAGASWTIVVNGVSNSSTASSLTFNEPNGSYSYSMEGVIAGNTGTQYVSSSTGGAFNLSGGPVLESVSYETEYEVATSVSPSNSGTVGPVVSWCVAGSVVKLSALAGQGYQFVEWQGSGSGSYSGGDNPANFTIGGPVSEMAKFAPAAPNSSPSSSPSGSVPLWTLLAALGIVAALAVILVLVMRPRRSPSVAPPVPAAVTSRPAATVAPTAQAGDEPWRE